MQLETSLYKVFNYLFNTPLLQVAVKIVTAASTTEQGNVTGASVMLATRWVPMTRVKVSARREGMHAFISVHVCLALARQIDYGWLQL